MSKSRDIKDSPDFVPKCTDLFCPCQDGLPCHYEDNEASGTKAWPMPPGVEKFPIPNETSGPGWPD